MLKSAGGTKGLEVTHTGRGRVVIKDKAISDIIGWTVLECYGVVGMASPNAYRGMTRLLSRDRLHQGIKVDRSDDALKVDLYIIVEYGLNVAEVAGNVRSQVAYQVEKTVGRPITELHIHVQGVRVGEKE